VVILIQCADQVGLVATIAAILSEQHINIVAMREHVDTQENRFFVRLETEGETNKQLLQVRLEAALPPQAQIILDPAPQKKIVVLVTKEYHCLGDILLRHHFQTLGAEVAAVIGNHLVLEDICKRFEVPFTFLSHEEKSKVVFEAELMEQIEKHQPDYIVLAKFMRILSPEFVERYIQRIINIHHSFLPAFVGANPYKQAYERGVKLIGATAHFVTNQLDEGPIIAQQIIQVTHSFTTSKMVRAGKEIETAVLAKALQLVFEDRVLLHKNKTIIFE
jgi:formyltetrahydrofolate deformylase